VPDKDDPLAEYEAEFAHVVDPSGFRVNNMTTHSGEKIVPLLCEATDLIVEDCVRMLNEGQVAIAQYMLSNGMSFTGAVSADGHTVRIFVQLPADEAPFITQATEGTEQ
jgi:hypothetical protein